MVVRRVEPSDVDVAAAVGTRRRQLVVASVSLSVMAAVVVGLDAIAGSRLVLRTALHVRPELLVYCVAFQLLALVSYAGPYWVALRTSSGARIPPTQAAAWSMTGFAAFLPWGGFEFDKRLLSATTDPQRARRCIRLLSVLEYLALSPVAWAAALTLALRGDKAQSSLYLSWIIGVPVGVVFAFWAVQHLDRIRRHGAAGRWIGNALESMMAVARAARQPRAGLAVAGMSLYWAAEIASFAVAIKAFGVEISVPAAIVALATGYTPTRRTLPLAGSGIAAVLLCLAGTWVGIPLQQAIPGVIVYHLVCVGTATVIGAIAVHRLEREDRTTTVVKVAE